jgi:hypothetical protein
MDLEAREMQILKIDMTKPEPGAKPTQLRGALLGGTQPPGGKAVAKHHTFCA